MYMTSEIIIRLIADGAIVPIILVGSLALLSYAPKGHRFEVYARILMAGLTSYLIAKLVGAVYQPSLERPFEILGVDPGALFLNNPGFPSDHALFATALVAAVWYGTRKKVLTIVLGSLVLLICIGRVLALVHTPLDVIAGVAIGLIGALWYIRAPNFLRKS